MNTPCTHQSTTALAALKLCTSLALSSVTSRRDAYLDRLEEMSCDELAELAYAASLEDATDGSW